MPHKLPNISNLRSDSAPLIPLEVLEKSIQEAQNHILTNQFPEGYWWYTLEANESICAEYIFLSEFLGVTDPALNQALCRRMLTQQREDGSWALYYGATGDISVTLECYWALKLCGYSVDHPALSKARRFIQDQGGPTRVRVFTKIHMAMFGLAPWSSVPAMPLGLMLLPAWAPINIYEFSSWARACIVPLLIILNEKPVHPIKVQLDELYLNPPSDNDWNFVHKGTKFSLDQFFIYIDKLLKNIEKIAKTNPLRPIAVKRCIKYIRKHIEKTEDIFPALAYGAMALKTLGYGPEDHTVSKALKALRSFQQYGGEHDLPHIPRAWEQDETATTPSDGIYQQCCISPVWDTPWAALSLIESGLEKEHPALLESAKWLEKKQILQVRGDWSVKNKKAQPGGWSFEFENDYFPDVDDTIEVLMFLHQLGLPTPEMRAAYHRGLQWLLSMQSKNGGWAAFDVDNTLGFVNRIPFSDHGACLDPPTPDITGRMLEFLARIHFERNSPLVERALKFIYAEQANCGGWEGRWGVHYLYGTWCVLQGLTAIGEDPKDPRLLKARDWLLEVQHPDGGWGESCEGYLKGEFIPLKNSVPSQTAWALMGLIAMGMTRSPEVTRGIEFLLRHQKKDGVWDEKEFTGTGFPGHFYIRYHGYRHYFPLLALGKYRQAILQKTTDS
jgi:squalene-hopene/tetraprenyl-beta-curcumene cyclase